ncbi:MAG: class I SAM-dependent methyltransferase [Actinobacteria bacterium]|nr:class I SAM-dependent methyltransferase [Actinomycetota bacterium]
MTIDHKTLYNTEMLSKDYASRDYLEPAERAVIEVLDSNLSSMKMLDMGVGGGRTTKYFAPLALNYTGADYAHAMINACIEKYGDDYYFITCDARDMEELSDNSFDFVLFSFNGIDSFSHEDRISALKEIHRVLRPGGYFCFSSHNLNWNGLPDLFSLKPAKKAALANKSGASEETKDFKKNVDRGFRSAYKIARLSILNRSFRMKGYISKLRKSERGYIYDNSLNGKVKVYYITKDEQFRQLKAAGYNNISTICRNGFITSSTSLLNQDGWIYYLCQTGKNEKQKE